MSRARDLLAPHRPPWHLRLIDKRIAGLPQSGTFTITWDGATTYSLPEIAGAPEIQAALEQLDTINPGDVLVIDNADGSRTVQFGNDYRGRKIVERIRWRLTKIRRRLIRIRDRIDDVLYVARHGIPFEEDY